MAARLAPSDYDQLHHFIADGVWDAAPLESELLVQADRLVGQGSEVPVMVWHCVSSFPRVGRAIPCGWGPRAD